MRNEKGQGLAEYALILALIAAIAIVALVFFYDDDRSSDDHIKAAITKFIATDFSFESIGRYDKVLRVSADGEIILVGCNFRSNQDPACDILK